MSTRNLRGFLDPSGNKYELVKPDHKHTSIGTNHARVSTDEDNDLAEIRAGEVVLDIGNADNVTINETNVQNLNKALSGQYEEKEHQGTTQGNFASFNANGEIEDSGKNASSFVTPLQLASYQDKIPTIVLDYSDEDNVISIGGGNPSALLNPLMQQSMYATHGFIPVLIMIGEGNDELYWGSFRYYCNISRVTNQSSPYYDKYPCWIEIITGSYLLSLPGYATSNINHEYNNITWASNYFTANKRIPFEFITEDCRLNKIVSTLPATTGGVVGDSVLYVGLDDGLYLKQFGQTYVLATAKKASIRLTWMTDEQTFEAVEQMVEDIHKHIREKQTLADYGDYICTKYYEDPQGTLDLYFDLYPKNNTITLSAFKNALVTALGTIASQIDFSATLIDESFSDKKEWQPKYAKLSDLNKEVKTLNTTISSLTTRVAALEALLNESES